MSVDAPARPGRDVDDAKNLTILEHLQELRYRLMICAGGVFLALIASAFLATPALRWLKQPGESRVENFELIFTQPLEYWTTFFRVMLLIALALAMPIIVWQIFAFVGPGLTKHEKRWAIPIVLGASLMFVAGCAFAYYIELPPALHFLYDYPPDDVATSLPSIKYYIDFVTRLMLVTGLVFELPMLIMGLAKIGLVRSSSLLKWWRFALVGAFALSAIVTPTIDPITQSYVAIPMIVLYFLGAGLARLVEGHPVIPR